MRICLICTEKLPVPPLMGGAIQTYVDGVLPWISREHEVTVISRRAAGLPDRDETGTVCHERVCAQRPDDYVKAVAALLAARGPFELLVVYNRPAFVPELAAVAPGARLILSMHNDMFSPERFPVEAARCVLDRVETVVTISDYVRRTIDHQHPGYTAKLRTIRSGVDIDRIQPWFSPKGSHRRYVLREQLGIRSRPVILHVSRFSPKKGNHLVLAAFEQIHQSRPEAVLLIVGSARYGSDEADSYTRRLWRQARHLGDAVRFIGFRPPAELPNLLPVGDVFVCASQWQEPLARVHYEAMAAGLPIVTTDRGGNAEVVDECCNGLFARPHDDPAAFAVQIERFLSDSVFRVEAGLCGRKWAEERFTWERVARELLAVLIGG